jgi:effector-binding domain-containing protein
MKIVKNILIGFVALLVVLLLVGFCLPRKVHVERTLTINAPPEVIFKQVNTLKNWAKWAPWFRMDPTMEITFFGPESGVGSGYSWKSNNKKVGNGKVTILASSSDSILVNMDFMEHGTAFGGYTFSKEGPATHVIWSMRSDMGTNPFARYFGLMMDKMVGPDFEKGLHNLDSVSQLEAKKIPEMNPNESFHIEMAPVNPQQVMTFRLTSSMDSFPAKLSAMYPVIEKTLSAEGLKQSGPTFAIYHLYSPEKVDFEAGIPVNKKGTTMGVVIAKELKGCTTAMTEYKGPYNDRMKTAHDQIHEFIKSSHKEMAGAPWEVYVTGPGTETDSTKFVTKIYYPIK